MRRQIELSNEVAAALAGSEDAVLREIEAHVASDVFLRGNIVTLDGDESAAAAEATASHVLPVPAGPMPNVIVLRRIESTYCFWLTLFGATFSERWRHTTSSSTSVADVPRSSAPVIAEIVPGEIWWPAAMRSATSWTTSAAAATASSDPSSVTTSPRRNTSQATCRSTSRSTASSEPASSRATSLPRWIWRLTRGSP